MLREMTSWMKDSEMIPVCNPVDGAFSGDREVLRGLLETELCFVGSEVVCL